MLCPRINLDGSGAPPESADIYKQIILHSFMRSFLIAKGNKVGTSEMSFLFSNLQKYRCKLRNAVPSQCNASHQLKSRMTRWNASCMEITHPLSLCQGNV